MSDSIPVGYGAGHEHSIRRGASRAQRRNIAAVERRISEAFPDGGHREMGFALMPDVDQALVELGIEAGLAVLRAKPPAVLGRELHAFDQLASDDSPVLSIEDLASHVERARECIQIRAGRPRASRVRLERAVHPFVHRLVVRNLDDAPDLSVLLGSRAPQDLADLDVVNVARTALVQAKLSVLADLIAALKGKSRSGLWERIEASFSLTLSRGVARLLLILEQAGPEGWGRERRSLCLPLENGRGGLRALLTLAVHCEQELALRRWDAAARSVAQLREPLPDSYYKAMTMNGAEAAGNAVAAIVSQQTAAAKIRRVAEKRCWRYLQGKRLATELLLAPVPDDRIDRIRRAAFAELGDRSVTVLDASLGRARRVVPPGTSWAAIRFVVRQPDAISVGVVLGKASLDDLSYEDLGMMFQREDGAPRPSKLWRHFLLLLAACTDPSRSGSIRLQAWPKANADAGRKRLIRIARALQSVFPGVAGEPFDSSGRAGTQAVFQASLVR